MDSLIHSSTLHELGAVASVCPAGALVEVGVYKGGSAKVLDRVARAQGRSLYLYDTFRGIPCASAVDSHRIGDFADADYETVCGMFPDATVVQGIFPESAVAMPPVAFVHLDCDQYQSVKESAAFLGPLMVQGGIMWFDDSPDLEGAHQAAREAFGDRLLLSPTGKHFVRF